LSSFDFSFLLLASFLILEKLQKRGYDISLLCVYVSILSLLCNRTSVFPHNFSVFYAVRVVSKESRRLFLPRTSCSIYVVRLSSFLSLRFHFTSIVSLRSIIVVAEI
jgi:hypothetical protein